MKPPICELCGKDFRSEMEKGRLIRFADETPLPDGRVGHPRGVGWFCEQHYRAAVALADRSMGEALARLRRRPLWLVWTWLLGRLGG